MKYLKAINNFYILNWRLLLGVLMIATVLGLAFGAFFHVIELRNDSPILEYMFNGVIFTYSLGFGGLTIAGAFQIINPSDNKTFKL